LGCRRALQGHPLRGIRRRSRAGASRTV